MYSLVGIIVVVEVGRVLHGLIVPRHLLVLRPRGTVIVPWHVHHVSLHAGGIVGSPHARRGEGWPALLALHAHSSLVLRAHVSRGHALHGGAMRHSRPLGASAGVVPGRAGVHRGPVVSLAHARARPWAGAWIVHVLGMWVVALERRPRR